MVPAHESVGFTSSCKVVIIPRPAITFRWAFARGEGHAQGLSTPDPFAQPPLGFGMRDHRWNAANGYMGHQYYARMRK